MPSETVANVFITIRGGSERERDTFASDVSRKVREMATKRELRVEIAQEQENDDAK